MSDTDAVISSEAVADPLFWLEFRTFDDGDHGMLNDKAAKSSTSTAVPTSFPKFSSLPPELRMKVWSHLVQPRIVVVCCFQRGPSSESRRKELNQRTTSGNAVPAILHINRESRAEGLKHYELVFRWNISQLMSDTPIARSARVYFNFKVDALFLTGDLETYDSYGVISPMVYFLRREDTSRVRHIACPFKELNYPEQESDQIFGSLWHLVDRFPGTQTLLLTVGEGDEESIGVKSSFESTDNVMQNIWGAWMGGQTDTEARFMGDKQILLVKENALAEYIASHSK